MDRPKRARVAVDYAESESDASDSESESEAFDPDEGSDDASEDDDYEDDDVEESEEDEPVEEDEDDDDILVIDDEDDDVIDLEEWDPERIRQQVMLEFNQAYSSFGDFTSQDTRDAFRWIWNIERGERLVPVAELVSDSTLVQEHVVPSERSSSLLWTGRRAIIYSKRRNYRSGTESSYIRAS